MTIRPGRAVTRVVTWTGYVFCLLMSALWSWAGQYGFAAVWTILGLVYVWLLVDSPLPRRRDCAASPTMPRPAALVIRCSHAAAVPVETAGEMVAALCPTCDAQLPAAWLTCEHDNGIEITSFAERRGRQLCPNCGVTYWEETTTP